MSEGVMRERLRQTAERIERVRESFNALAESMPGKYAYNHPLFALRRDVCALALQAELAASEMAAQEPPK